MKILREKGKLKTLANGSEIESSKIVDKYQDLYNYIKKSEDLKDRIVISIILPMYNEENTIKTVLEDLPNNHAIEIIVVDDHSTDNSLKEIEKVNLEQKIKVISHKRNRGYGGAIISGISQAKGEIIVTMDSDGQHDPDDIINLVKPIFDGEADYTIGSRYKGAYYYQIPVFNRLGELIVEKLIKVFFGTRLMNNQTGFRAFTREVLPIFYDTKYHGYAFCTEQILKVSLSGFKIKECPIKVYGRAYGSSNIILTKIAVNIFSCLFHYILKKVRLTFKKTKGFKHL